MVFYLLVYKDAVTDTARKIESFRVGNKTLEKIDGVETFSDLMYRPAMPVKEVRFKGWAMSKVPDLSDIDDMDSEGRQRPSQNETLAETLARMKSGETLQDAYKRGAVPVSQKKSLHKRLKDFGSGHGRSIKAGSGHTRKEGAGSNHSRVKISPSLGSQAQPPSSIAVDAMGRRSCMVVRTLEASLNSCKMEPNSSRHERQISRHERERQTSRHDRQSTGSRSYSRSGGGSVGSLSFGTIEIRQYTRVLGDNPACPAGPPISLGWKYSPKSTVVSIDEYETGRYPRRRDSSLRVSVKRREAMLRALGYSTRDLIEADRVRKKDQILRERTVCRLKYRRLEATMENAKRMAHINKSK
uniref:Uncharacterized protein n=2 Tax=Pseudictyota dubia TaxID=2749911 RepID=A0A7R9ZGQ7_9STRA|mmetsp:Transcript_47854/g.88746  ORF Transcript_47854/g.88746 Transcript_47854/m.88746 type:complete len:356 (+) Transcript_47854:305-1372(+)